MGDRVSRLVICGVLIDPLVWQATAFDIPLQAATSTGFSHLA